MREKERMLKKARKEAELLRLTRQTKVMSSGFGL